MTAEPDPSRCPLCGASNDCALATKEAEPPRECWCRAERFPETLLAQAPPTACICRRCQLEATGTPRTAPDDREGESPALLDSKTGRE